MDLTGVDSTGEASVSGYVNYSHIKDDGAGAYDLVQGCCVHMMALRKVFIHIYIYMYTRSMSFR